VIVTHNIELAKMADRTLVMKDGVIVWGDIDCNFFELFYLKIKNEKLYLH
jgi:ABC-type lipoprotein export system ATPase subunit